MEDETTLIVNEHSIFFFWKYFPVSADKSTTRVKWLQNLKLRNIKPKEKTIFTDDSDLFERQIQVLNLEQLYLELEQTEPFLVP